MVDQPTSAPPGAHAPVQGSRIGQIVLTVLGAGLIVTCGLVVTGFLLLSVGVTGYVVGLVAALLPVAPLVLVYLWLDRYEPEPAGLLVFAFGWGASVATVGALLLSLPPTLLLTSGGADAETAGAVLVAPVVEETLKALGIVAILVVGRRSLDGIVDGLVYAGFVGIGFAFTENILYLGNALLASGGPGLVATFVLRGVVSPFAHPLFTAATGIGLVLATRHRGAPRVLFALAGLAVAILLHGVWNYTAVGDFMNFVTTFIVLQVPLFLAFVAIALFARSRERRLLRRNLLPYVEHGWFTAAEVQMLTTLSERRTTRRWAATGGPRSSRAMRQFQVGAARLAHLRHRIDRDTAPWDARARERQLLERAAAARATFLAATSSAGHGAGPVRR